MIEMGRRIHKHHPAPPALLDAADDTIEQHEEDYSERDLSEALARLHHETVECFGDIPTSGPFSATDDYLVYAVSVDTWIQMCDSKEIYEDARKWSYRAMLLAAVRVAIDDPHEPVADVRKAVTDDQRPLVVQAPWAEFGSF